MIYPRKVTSLSAACVILVFSSLNLRQSSFFRNSLIFCFKSTEIDLGSNQTNQKIVGVSHILHSAEIGVVSVTGWEVFHFTLQVLDGFRVATISDRLFVLVSCLGVVRVLPAVVTCGVCLDNVFHKSVQLIEIDVAEYGAATGALCVSGFGSVVNVLHVEVAGLEYLIDKPDETFVADTLAEYRFKCAMVNFIKAGGDVTLDKPNRTSPRLHLSYGALSGSFWPEAVRKVREGGFVDALQDNADCLLNELVLSVWKAELAHFTIAFRYHRCFVWLRVVGLVAHGSDKFRNPFLAEAVQGGAISAGGFCAVVGLDGVVSDDVQVSVVEQPVKVTVDIAMVGVVSTAITFQSFHEF